MSQLPQDWLWAPLGDLGTEVRDRVSPDPSVTYEMFSVPAFPTGLPEILKGSEIKSSKTAVEPGDVLLCKINPRINRVWSVIPPRNALTQLASTEYLVLRIPNVALSLYVMWYLRSPRFREWIGLSVEGATGSHTRAKSPPILRQLIPVPPETEQRRIVDAIEEHFSRLNAAQSGIACAKDRLLSMRSLLIGSILRIPEGPPIGGHADIGSLPPGWIWQRASEVCSMVSSGSTPKASDLFAGEGEIPFIKVYNLGFEGRLDFTVKPTFVARQTHEGLLRRSRLLPGDVLTNIVGPPLGKVSVVPSDKPEWNMNQAVAAFRPGPSLKSRFLAYLLMARTVMRPLLNTGKATAGQINLSISACRQLWLPIPPLVRQDELVGQLDDILSTWAATLKSVQSTQAVGESLRRSLLHAAFSGKLITQHVNEEPVPPLLEIIRTEPASVVSTTGRRRKVLS